MVFKTTADRTYYPPECMLCGRYHHNHLRCINTHFLQNFDVWYYQIWQLRRAHPHLTEDECLSILAQA
jgi:hypothetical protein